MSGTISITQFLSKGFFHIPAYQRAYSWHAKNMRELIDDIQEASLSNRDHYLGTVVTSKGQEQDHFYIVDGQQRITSIIFLFHKVLPFIEGDEKIAFRYNCIGTSD